MPLPCIRILDNGEFSRRQVIDCCWALPNNSPRLPTRRDEGIGSIRANNLCLFRCIKADDSSQRSVPFDRPTATTTASAVAKEKKTICARKTIFAWHLSWLWWLPACMCISAAKDDENAMPDGGRTVPKCGPPTRVAFAATTDAHAFHIPSTHRRRLLCVKTAKLCALPPLPRTPVK